MYSTKNTRLKSKVYWLFICLGILSTAPANTADIDIKRGHNLLLGEKWWVHYDNPVATGEAKKWNVKKVNIKFEDNLDVYTNKGFGFKSDITWHNGETREERLQNIGSLVGKAALNATNNLKGARNVIMNIDVLEFHGMGINSFTAFKNLGVNRIKLRVDFHDAKNQTSLWGPQIVYADLTRYPNEIVNKEESNIAAIQESYIAKHLTAVFKGILNIGPDNRGSFEKFGI